MSYFFVWGRIVTQTTFRTLNIFFYYYFIIANSTVFLFLKKSGESWKPDNCTTQTCVDDKVITEYVPCKQVVNPVCANGLSLVRLYDETGCCPYYECRCK